MSTNNLVYPKFEPALCHPRYWLVWFSILFFYIMMLLPYPWLRVIGRHLGKSLMLLLKKRVKITRRNLELCFPTMSNTQIEHWIVKNFESVGMGLIETGMAWFWPSWRIHRWCKIKGLEHITHAQQQGKGVLLIGLHFLTLELGARVFGEYNPGIGVYRPHNNKLMDWLQTWGRLRSNKYMLNRKDVKGMICALKKGEIVWYAPDHDYGPRSSVFVPLFAVEQAATTVGTYILARNSHPEIIPFTTIRTDDGSGYTIAIQPPVKNFPLDNEIEAAYTMNKVVEQEILRAPTQYMWMHRRFKTRPENVASLY